MLNRMAICNIHSPIHKIQISLLDVCIRSMFLITASAQLIRLLSIIRILDNGPMLVFLDDFENNSDKVLVFWASFNFFKS
jgi:hypothetical protein